MAVTEVTTEATVPAGDAPFTYDRDRAAATRVLEGMTAHVRNTGIFGVGTLANFSEWWGTRGGITVPDLADLDESWIDPAKKDEYKALVNAKYGAELKDIRGRVLHFVADGYIRLAQANELLEAGGLPVYTRPADSMNHYFATLRGTNITVTSEESAAAIQERAAAAIRAAITEFGGDPAAYPDARVTVAEQATPIVEQSEIVIRLYRN